MNILRYKNNEIPFTVRILQKGEPYGKDMSLIYQDDEPVIEFYDFRYKHQQYQGAMLGQFVSSYCISTFNSIKTGLFLSSGSPDWSVTADNISLIQNWIKDTLSIKTTDKEQQKIHKNVF